jgi:hypothetical protein
VLAAEQGRPLRIRTLSGVRQGGLIVGRLSPPATRGSVEISVSVLGNMNGDFAKDPSARCSCF